MRKLFPWLIGLVGILFLAFGLAADRLGFGAQAGLGFRQILLIILGSIAIFLGIFMSLPRGHFITDRIHLWFEGLKTTPANPREVLIKSLAIGAWFGLVTGLVEGIALWVFRQLGWMIGIYEFLGGSLEIVWISAAFDLSLFLLVGLGVGLLARFFKRLPVIVFGIYLFTFLALFDGLLLLLHRWIGIYMLIILAAVLAIELTRWLTRKLDAALIFWRRSLPWVAGLAVFAFVAIQGGFWLREEIALSRLPEAQPGSPNIILIVVDTLRADHLASYGYSRQTSPNIDRLAGEGVLFENAISPSNTTSPSHASIFNGRYLHEQNTDGRPLNGHDPTIAEVLSANGYRTGGFSGIPEVINRVDGFGQGFIHFQDYYSSFGSKAIGAIYGWLLEYEILHSRFGLQYRTDRVLAEQINRNALQWLEQDKEKPYYLFVNYFDVHAPYIPPQPFRGMFSEYEKPGGQINTDWDMEHIYIPMAPEQLQGEIDAYDGAISYVDHYIGELLIELENRGLLENTIVMITSDHGEMFGEHGLLGHAASLYIPEIHVPLIVWQPAHIPGNIRVNQPVSLTSLPSTILDLVGVDENNPFLRPSLQYTWMNPDGQQNWPDPIAEIGQFAWVPEKNLTRHGGLKSIVTPQFHYIIHEKFGEELYELDTDPEEKDNLAKNPELTEILFQFRDRLQQLQTSGETISQRPR